MLPHRLRVLRRLLIPQLLEKLRRNKQPLLEPQLQVQVLTTTRQQLIKLKRLAMLLRLQARWQA